MTKIQFTMSQNEKCENYKVKNIFEIKNIEQLANSYKTKEDFISLLENIIIKLNTRSTSTVYNFVPNLALNEIKNYLTAYGKIRITKSYDQKSNEANITYTALSENFILFEEHLRENFIAKECNNPYIVDIIGQTDWSGTKICSANVVFDLDDCRIIFAIKDIKNADRKECEQLNDILKNYKFSMFLTPAYLSMTACGTGKRIKITYRVNASCKIDQIDDSADLDLSSGGSIDKLMDSNKTNIKLLKEIGNFSSCVTNFGIKLKSNIASSNIDKITKNIQEINFDAENLIDE